MTVVGWHSAHGLAVNRVTILVEWGRRRHYLATCSIAVLATVVTALRATYYTRASCILIVVRIAASLLWLLSCIEGTLRLRVAVLVFTWLTLLSGVS